MVAPSVLFPVWRMVFGGRADYTRYGTNWDLVCLEGSVKGRKEGAFGKKHGLTGKHPLRGPAAKRGRLKHWGPEEGF